jgi:hypothetical protein
MKAVAAVALRDFQRPGCNKKCIASESNGAEWVIKVGVRAHAGGRRNKDFANELLAHALASLTGVDVPEFAIVEIREATSSDFVPGHYFGSHLLPHDSLESGSLIAKQTEKFDLVDIYALHALDVLLMNPDRKATDVLYRPRQDGSSRGDLVAIDFGNVLTGGDWTAANLASNHGGNAGHVGDWLFWYFGDPESPDRGKQAAAHLSHLALSGAIAAALAAVAPFWDLAASDQLAATQFVQARAEHLEQWVAEDLETARRGSR